ncbi:MAG: envelope [Pacific salmon nidovirus]|uniref:Envelope n=1 Tax=Pacific salmon nidovirus TaxID=2587487 RepID=A0AAE6M5H9_9NIDO|nr:MAG: envelope [Pacific salmon nidovirus]QEG08240.1 MAG: envelope [Pacific salmon nidovirus]
MSKSMSYQTPSTINSDTVPGGLSYIRSCIASSNPLTELLGFAIIVALVLVAIKVLQWSALCVSSCVHCSQQCCPPLQRIQHSFKGYQQLPPEETVVAMSPLPPMSTPLPQPLTVPSTVSTNSTPLKETPTFL